MRVLQINILDSGSTGEIVKSIGELCRMNNVQSFSVSSCIDKKYSNLQNHFYFDNYVSCRVNRYFGNWFGENSLVALFSTIRLIKIIEKVSPDVIHLHNIHGYCLNYVFLFRYLKSFALISILVELVLFNFL